MFTLFIIWLRQVNTNSSWVCYCPETTFKENLFLDPASYGCLIRLYDIKYNCVTFLSSPRWYPKSEPPEVSKLKPISSVHSNYNLLLWVTVSEQYQTLANIWANLTNQIILLENIWQLFSNFVSHKDFRDISNNCKTLYSIETFSPETDWLIENLMFQTIA